MTPGVATEADRSGPPDGRRPLAVVAVGGNALEDRAEAEGLHGALADLAADLAAIVASGWRLVVVHGSGPQVGRTLRRAELARDEIQPVSMDLATAETQGSIGVQLQRAVAGRLPVSAGGCVTLVSQVVVDPDDPAMGSPSKPIGPGLAEDRALALAAEHGWTVGPTDRGWRRLVPSPAPERLVELDAVVGLLDAGVVVVAGGGGGVPVVTDGAGGLRGVEAVVDKDHTAGLLARELGAGALVIGTTVPAVGLDLGSARQRWLGRVTVDELRAHLDAGQFPPGSMGPKVQAVVGHLDAGGDHAAICHLDRLRDGLRGDAGTIVTPAGRA